MYSASLPRKVGAACAELAEASVAGVLQHLQKLLQATRISLSLYIYIYMYM